MVEIFNKYNGDGKGCKNCLIKNTDKCFVRVTGDIEDVCPNFEYENV